MLRVKIYLHLLPQEKYRLLIADLHKLRNVEQPYVIIWSTDFHQNETINVKIISRRFHCVDFDETHTQ